MEILVFKRNECQKFWMFWLLTFIFGCANSNFTIAVYPFSAAICNAVLLKFKINCIKKYFIMEISFENNIVKLYWKNCD